MKEIKDLRQGDKLYSFDGIFVVWYTYLCVHPKGGGNYHILINACEDPIRIYKDKINFILNQGFTTYSEAEQGLAIALENQIKIIRTT